MTEFSAMIQLEQLELNITIGIRELKVAPFIDNETRTTSGSGTVLAERFRREPIAAIGHFTSENVSKLPFTVIVVFPPTISVPENYTMNEESI